MNSELPISRKAFSLLELLVSITLLALVSALIYGAFFQVSNSSLKVKESLSQSQELRLLMKMVLDDLQAVQYLEHFVEDKESNSQTGIISSLEWVQSIENNHSVHSFVAVGVVVAFVNVECRRCLEQFEISDEGF